MLIYQRVSHEKKRIGALKLEFIGDCTNWLIIQTYENHWLIRGDEEVAGAMGITIIYEP